MALFPSTLKVSALDGVNGFRLNGEGAYDFAGFTVAAAGDINRDGFADIALVAPQGGSGGSLRGAAYVVLGHKSGFAPSTDLSKLDGLNGFKITSNGPNRDGVTGDAVSAGDLDGDGFGDLLVSTSDAATYRIDIVYGKAGFSGTLDLAKAPSVLAVTPRDSSTNVYVPSLEIAAAGDLNGDGYDDVLVGNSTAAQAGDPSHASGAAYVVFGRKGSVAKPVELSKLDGKTGFKLAGTKVADFTGNSVARAGDINGDGFDDLLIGAPGTDGRVMDSGAGYVVFGHKGAFAKSLDLSRLNGKTGFLLKGIQDSGAQTGLHVSGAGDVNADGLADMIVGAPGAVQNKATTGAAYVVFGHKGAFAKSLDLSKLDGTTGFKIAGSDTFGRAGQAVSSAGDVNGDGFDDVIVGAPNARTGKIDAGAAYVVFGHAGKFAASLSVAKLDGANGFKIAGKAQYDGFGSTVSSAGDVNGDGFADLAVGASSADVRGENSGAAYVIFGKAPTGPVKLAGTVASQTLAGGAKNDTLSGAAGDDRLYGNGGKDTLAGGKGADTFVFNKGLGKANIDRITDFEHNRDTVALDSSIFKGLKEGALAAAAFYAKPAAHDLSDRILYDKKTGALFFDGDGNKPGGHEAVQFATLQKGLALDAGDFLVI